MLRSDIERKRQFGVAETERLPDSAYSPEATRDVYARLLREAASALRAGQCVIVDAVHGQAEERSALAHLATELGVAFDGLWLEAPTAVRVERVGARTGDASDAGASVAASQASYDIGPLAWPRLDVSGGTSETAQAASRCLGIQLQDTRFEDAQ